MNPSEKQWMFCPSAKFILCAVVGWIFLLRKCHKSKRLQLRCVFLVQAPAAHAKDFPLKLVLPSFENGMHYQYIDCIFAG